MVIYFVFEGYCLLKNQDFFPPLLYQTHAEHLSLNLYEIFNRHNKTKLVKHVLPIFQMEELRAHATDWTQNIQHMSVDFHMPGKIDDPFKRRRRKRRHGQRSHGHSTSANGAPEGPEEQHENGSGSGTYSSSYSSSESESGSETGSQATQTDRVPEEKTKEEPPPDAHMSQPLDYFGENLAFIDESSDAQSARLHVDPLIDPKQPNSRHAKKRRHRRPIHRRSPKTKRSNDRQQPNGDAKPVQDLPLKPQEWHL